MIRTNQTHKNYIGTKPGVAEGQLVLCTAIFLVGRVAQKLRQVFDQIFKTFDFSLVVFYGLVVESGDLGGVVEVGLEPGAAGVVGNG